MQTRATATSARGLLDVVLADLTRHGIEHAVIRPPGRDGSGVLEVDLLVGPGSLAATEALLAEDGFARRRSWGRRPHRFHLKPVTGGEELDWLKVDLVTDLCFGRWHELPTRAADRCLAHPDRPDRDHLAPADELLALVGHALLDGRGLTPEIQARLRVLARRDPGPGALAAQLVPGGGGVPSWEHLVAAIQAEDWATVERAAPVLRKRVTDSRLAVFRRRTASRVARRSTKVLTAVRARGVVVALVGPDGTGKSTLAGAVSRSVAVPARVLYGGTYRSGIRRRKVPGMTTVGVAARLLVTRAEVEWHRLRGRLVILDRHPVEARPQPSDLMPIRTRIRRSFIAATLRKPDLLIALDAPAPLLHDRRPEHGLQSLDRDRCRHLVLVAQTRGSQLIDATASADEVRDEAVELVWAQLVGPVGEAA
ncbi:MAG TPA: ATP-binding protein [Acidimicrobiales bacterium]|nr:ATP-binding protein [Acidimicrobiales bacterium]